MLDSSAVDTTLDAAEALAVLQAVADPIRWRVLTRLSTCRRCVCDLQAEIDIAPNLLSYHLKVLRDAGLVLGTRRGRWIDYTLTDDAQARVKAALPGELGRW
ncbi:transcriptional regulator [Tessaracoccus lapidicaptus]|uniref:Transcriptional regulator n=1 Tax=Tessaracoccus lapidicaptus TaxID=1427523 RepID=A0A1C0ALS0_9ACTN|nr:MULTISPECIES: metalloregulator ArsR/SmtB family transcription factor [Tessaracoccus]AQX15447.1 transcriptional regulator [Tessaracoccus sp. T2.5-30]OCL33815.1 transcriptional regulator [Tessaracoccus lapidicaptus]VEP39754.1 HTH-type transcriptional repressor SmtB [Tessaracoccus lapidicaptus]